MNILNISLVAFAVSIQLLHIDALTRLTNLTFVPHKASWHDAREVCHKLGARLVQVWSETKNNVVQNVAGRFSVHEEGKKAMHLDVFTDHSDGREYFSAETCEPIGWTNWEDGQFTEEVLAKYCGKLHFETGKWTRSNCGATRRYICEHVSEEICPYSVWTNTSLIDVADGSSVNRTVVEVSGCSECRDVCDHNISAEGVECWGVTCSRYRLCSLFFATDPFLLRNTTNWRNVKGLTSHIRECYNEFLGGAQIVVNSTNTNIKPGINCSSVTSAMGTKLSTSSKVQSSQDSITSTYLEHSMVANLTPNASETSRLSTGSHQRAHAHSSVADVNWMTQTGSMSKTSPSTFSSTSTLLETEESIHNCSTSDDVRPEINCTSFSPPTTIESFIISTVTSTRQSANVTSAPQDNIGSTHNNNVICYCQCRVEASILEKQSFLEEMLTKLTINTTQLSSVRRKLISVKDERPLAVGIGWSGVMCLALGLGLVLICDASRVLSAKNKNPDYCSA